MVTKVAKVDIQMPCEKNPRITFMAKTSIHQCIT